MQKPSIARPWRHLLLLIAGLSHHAPALADRAELLGHYTQLQPQLEKNTYGIPIHIQSRDEDDTMTGVVYGVLPHPFATITQALSKAANWCELAPQHLNIKACTYSSQGDFCQLQFYSGRKHYERADDVYRLNYRFERLEQARDYMHLRLSAEEGPAGTRQYQLHIKATPIDAGRSFIHFSYSYRYNMLTRMGMGSYLATLGRGKVGFSITGTDRDGRPIYVNGVRGIIERNAVRYYLAIQSFLDTLGVQQDARFEARITQWFDLTERYPLQLHEMDKRDYLQYKHQERKDQLRLQQQATGQSSGTHCD